ncbi:MAG: hypothetical protein P4L73_19765 [Caulobacteraceae bacterium]|nr:hypothetical protein [Caulobacteraceae bacterium]
MLSATSVMMTYVRTARLQGADRQRIATVERALAQHASSESVTAMGGRIDELEADVKQVAAAMTRIAVIETQLTGLDRLMTRDMDELKHSLRRLEERSFEPAAAPAHQRRRSPAD